MTDTILKWIAIKAELGKLELPGTPATYLPERIERSALRELPAMSKHTYAGCDLPRHHRDPFDRLLVAKAQIESLTLVTADSVFRKYNVKQLAA